MNDPAGVKITAVRSRTPKAPDHSGFVVKCENGDGTVTWMHPETMEEITMHSDTAPTPVMLRNLAANGIVPTRPALDDEPRSEVNSGNGDGDSFAEAPDDDPLSRVLTRLRTVGPGQRTEVKIYKKRDAKDVYCGTLSIDDFDEHGEEAIRAHWGPGTFVVRVYGPSQQEAGSNYGKFVRLTSVVVEIEPSMVPLKSAIPGASADSSMHHMMQPMMDQMNRMMQALTEKQSAADPMAQLMQTMALLRQMGVLQPQKPVSVMEQLKEMDAVLKFKKTHMSEDGDSGEKESGGDDMMGMFGQLLGAFKSIQGQQPQQMQPIPQLQAPQQFQPQPALHSVPSTFPPAAANPQPVPNSPTNQSEDEAMSLFLKMWLGGLIAAAERNADIEPYAVDIADKMPEEMLDVLESAVWFDSLKVAVPDYAAKLDAVKPWLDKVRDRAMVLLQEPQG